MSKQSPTFAVIADELMQSFGMDVAEFAKRTGISKGLYYKWQEGASPQRATMIRLTEALEVDFVLDANGQPVGWRKRGEKREAEGLSAILDFAAGRIQFSDELMIQQYEEMRLTYGLPRWEDLSDEQRRQFKREYIVFKSNVSTVFARFVSTVASALLSDENETVQQDRL